MSAKVGLTKNAGWEMGMRMTFAIDVHDAWEFMFSNEGVALWLGEIEDMKWEKGAEYKTNAGTEGVVRVFKRLSHVRLSWQKKGWDNSSTLQIRMIKGKGKTTISFHHEKLASETQRKAMLTHWEKVLNKLKTKLT